MPGFFKSQKKIALALGAGGFKGFTHIGVIKALEELDIKITHIGGSSIGSFVGGMYALWEDIDKVEKIMLSFDLKKLTGIFSKDISMNKGLFKGEKVLKTLETEVGNASIEDCIIPFVAVSVDIVTGEKIYFTSGPLKHAIRASGSLPVLFKPYEFKGKQLVDGGISEIVPVEATKKIGGKRTLGVSLQSFPTKKGTLSFSSLSRRIYRYSAPQLAKQNLSLAEEKLEFLLDDEKLIDIVKEPKKLIELGYKETMEMFKDK